MNQVPPCSMANHEGDHRKPLPKGVRGIHRMVPDQCGLRAALGMDPAGQMVWNAPVAGARKIWRTERGLLHCGNCQHQTSVTVGTVFEGARKPLLLWFHLMWLMMAQKTGLSARNLCGTYGFGSHQTAWGWPQKLRSVMIREGREQLCGRVEVDETYIGGRKSGARGCGAEGKTLVLVAVEGEASGLGRVRFRCVSAADAEHIEPFVRDYVDPGAVVVTDGLPAYNGLSASGFDHQPCCLSTGGDDAVGQAGERQGLQIDGSVTAKRGEEQPPRNRRDPSGHHFRAHDREHRSDPNNGISARRAGRLRRRARSPRPGARRLRTGRAG